MAYQKYLTELYCGFVKCSAGVGALYGLSCGIEDARDLLDDENMNIRYGRFRNHGTDFKTVAMGIFYTIGHTMKGAAIGTFLGITLPFVGPYILINNIPM